MAKFRKIVKEIEAEQFLGEKVNGLCENPKCFINIESSNSPHVHTIHNNQPVQVVKGDWIIPEPDGVHFYPCKDEIFQKTYEAVNE